jgi:2-amino-4-hydroxy-6-hydroxymethyldihydropteridine diphosphokinase
MPTIYLALGSNIGDRGDNLRRAVAALAPEVQVASESPVYETPAWGYQDQPPFLNMALQAETSLPPEALLAHVKRLEIGLGRTPSFHWGPRLIDIDILFYDDLILDTPDLTIPHPRLHERAFVLVPLNNLAPRLVHPVLGQTVSELLASVDTAGITRWGEAL